jgi:TonB-dependent SusC/RagA subfamily outer membrane receptor
MVHPVVRALRSVFPLLTGLAGAVAMSVAQVGTAAAQAGVVTGTVVDAKAGRPLADATVIVEGTQNGARTGVRGDFRIQNVTGTNVRVRVTRVGYQPRTVDATVGTPVRVELTELVVKLDELVVTGTVGEAQQRSLGNAIGKVDVAATTKIAPPAKLQDVLSVNVPGVRIIRASGAIGSGGTTRIRGSGSLSLTNEPLIYVDGVRVNNAAATYSDAFQGAQESPSRVNDLNPEEIESIEVLKGPSAATIYGTEASNGVIQIITKRGRNGRPTFDVHADVGANWLMNPEGRYEPNYYWSPSEQKVKEFRVLDFNKAAGFPSPFSTGTPFAAGGQLSGGSEQLRYFFSVDGNRDEGYVDYNWQNKYAGRANLSYSSANDKFKVDLSLGSIRSKLRGASGVQPITTSILWACNFPGCEPGTNGPNDPGWNGPGHGYQYYRPEDYNKVFGFDNVDRTTFSVKLSHRPLPWLRHHLTVGPDFTNQRSSLLVEKFPLTDGFNPFFTSSADGTKTGTEQRYTFLTADYGISADWNVSKSLVSTTSAGAQYYYKQYEFVQANGTKFAIPGPSDITGSAIRTGSEGFQENKTFGIYAQEQLAFKNRLFLTGALRGDDNSAFGSDFSAVYYPKFSVSWVLSEEPFLAGKTWLPQLKLRGAWGRAGQQPDVFSAIRTYQTKVGNAGVAGVSPQNFGNSSLKPEVGEELEAGVDVGLFNQRMGIEFTYYNKKVKDAILSIPLRPSRGFPGFQFTNIGETQNKGIELAIDGTVLTGKKVGLDLRATFATNDSKILDMGGTSSAFVGGSFIQQWNVQGFAPSSFFYKKVVSSTVQTVNVGGVPLPIGFAPQCEGGTDLGNGDGTTVDCATAPRLFSGRPTPSWNGSLSATLTLGKRLHVLGLVDALGGNTVLVGDVAAIHSFFFSSKQILEGTDPILSGYLGTELLQGDANSVGATGIFKGGFAKLRTVSASYDFPDKFARWLGASRGSLTVAAENMATLWRAQKYSYGVPWIDPEIVPNRAPGSFGGAAANDAYTQESWPQAARIRTTIRLTF